MRDHDGRPAFRQRVQRFLDGRLVLRIRMGGRLVEHENRRILDDGARDGHALRLAARQVRAFASQHRVVALRQLHYAIVNLGLARGGLHLLVGGTGTAQTDVVRDARSQKHAVLEHHGNTRKHLAGGHLGKLRSVHAHRP